MLASSRLRTGALLIVAVLALSGCSFISQAGAGPASTGDVLPTPPPMPAGKPQPPTPTPVPAPAAAGIASAKALFNATFDDPADLAIWKVVDASDILQRPSIWQVADGRLEQVSDGEGLPGMYATALVTGDPQWDDYELHAAAYATGNDELGIVARASERGYYVFRLLPAASGSAKRVLSRYDAPTYKFSTIATADGPGFEPGRWYTLSLRIQGDHMQAFVDGQPALDAHDPTLTRGQAGVYGYAQGGLQFDNFAVQALPNANQ